MTSNPVVQVSNTSPKPTVQPSNTSAFANQLSGNTGESINSAGVALNANGTPLAFSYQPTNITSTSTQQTSPQDVTSIVNSAMQQLVGRFATPEEIKTYGAELLAAERAHPGMGHSQINYDANTSKRLSETTTDVSSGVDATSFIQNLINGSAEAKQYRIAGTYMQGLQQMADQFKGSFSG